MRLAFSNIAWDVSEDRQVVDLLRNYQVDAIDVVPNKYFPDPGRTGDAAIGQVRHWWLDQGFEITGMQALLFGTRGLNLFGPAEVQTEMLTHLDGVCRIAAGLGATRLVFGSPKSRDRSGLGDQEAEDIALAFFDRLAAIASRHAVVICLEPNPPRYGCNFMLSSADTARIVRLVGRTSIRMQIDTGAIRIGGEDIAQVLAEYAPLVGHIHASEPDMVPLGDGGVDHMKASQAVADVLPEHLVSIETLATVAEPHLAAMERSLQTAIRCYRNADPGR